jgi:hypothetical protein
VKTPLAQKRMRRSSARKATSSGCALWGKSSRNDSDSGSDVTDDLSFDSLSSKVVELENALCNQDNFLC